MSDVTTAEPAARRPDLVGWALRVLVAAVFLYEGTDKFGSRRLWIRLFEQIGFGQWFRYATGALEVAGAALLLIPKATPVASAVLACTMFGALLAHAFIIGFGPQTIVVATLLALLAAIAWRR
jgi:putative oxidoreductase